MRNKKLIFSIILIICFLTVINLSIASSFNRFNSPPKLFINQNKEFSDWSPYWKITCEDPNGIQLLTGWNLIGWYQDYSTTASSLSVNITGCTSISKWDADTQTYHTYIVGGSPSFDFQITQGMGVFVDVTEESIWYGDG